MILRTRPPARALLVSAALCAAVACTGASEVCDPADPLCGNGPPDPTVSSIAVTSPIDSLIAVGRTAQLTAAARDQNNNPITTAFTWASSNQTAATVNSAGLVSAQAPGSTTISATSGSATGTYGMRAVAADLSGITALLSDPYVAALVSGLDAATSTALNTFLSACSNAIVSGNVLGVEDCLNTARAQAGANGTDTALLGVLDLFFDQSYRLLQLGR